jgi:hypothetical protein
LDFIPLIISATGIVPQSLFKNLKILDLGNTLVVEIQKGILTLTQNIIHNKVKMRRRDAGNYIVSTALLLDINIRNTPAKLPCRRGGGGIVLKNIFCYKRHHKKYCMVKTPLFYSHTTLHCVSRHITFVKLWILFNTCNINNYYIHFIEEL